MPDKHADSRTQAAECVSSLQRAIQEAGGTCLTAKQMQDMSLLDFITTIASQNGIHFRFIPPDLRISK